MMQPDDVIDMTEVDEHVPIHDHVHLDPEETPREYKKLALIILGITIGAGLLTWVRGWYLSQFFNDFMAIFFITFAGFKFINIEAFALIYRSYDLISQKFKAWSYIFPFVEAILGFAYLLTIKTAGLDIVTMLITGVSGYGVWKAVNEQKQKGSKFQCACLGTTIKLPLSTISFLEDGLMFAMAFALLFIK